MYVLIPSYEPCEKLIILVSDINKRTDYKILIVDDGSGPKYQKYFEIAKVLGCVVLHHYENKGKGEALKTGFKYLLSEGINDSIVCADSDGQHDIQDIIRIADKIDSNKNEMILGVRKFDGEIPAKSRLGNSLTAFLFNRITKLNITDTQTGLRGYPASMLPWLLSVEGSRYDYEFNLLLKSVQDNISIKQIPILTIYENNNECSHFHPIRDSVRVYIPLLKFSISSFISAIIDFILLFVFQGLTGSLFLGVIFARAISSIFNYSVNKILVFKAKGVGHMQSAPKYFSLVVVIMLLNYLLLSFMANYLYVPTVLAKILTELILFILSYSIQKKFVFLKREKVKLKYKKDCIRLPEKQK